MSFDLWVIVALVCVQPAITRSVQKNKSHTFVGPPLVLGHLSLTDCLSMRWWGACWVRLWSPPCGSVTSSLFSILQGGKSVGWWHESGTPFPNPPTGGATVMLWIYWLVPSLDSGLVNFLSAIGCGGLIALTGLVAGGGRLAGLDASCWLGGESDALMEVCCMILAQHISTSCDPVNSTGCGHWLFLSKCWRVTSLFKV